jgi:hypothetical protein
MSRFQEWTSAERGLGKFASTHIELDFRGAGRPNKFYGVELGKLINEFSKINKIKGSYTTRILIISDLYYKQWCEFITAKSIPLT